MAAVQAGRGEFDSCAMAALIARDLFVFVVACAGALAAAVEVQLAGEHVIDHRVDGFEVTVAAKLLALELLEGLVGPLVDESAHGHSP